MNRVEANIYEYKNDEENETAALILVTAGKIKKKMIFVTVNNTLRDAIVRSNDFCEFGDLIADQIEHLTSDGFRQIYSNSTTSDYDTARGRQSVIDLLRIGATEQEALKIGQIIIKGEMKVQDTKQHIMASIQYETWGAWS